MNPYDEPKKKGITFEIPNNQSKGKMSKSISESTGVGIREDLTRLIDDNGRGKFTKNSSTSISFNNTLPTTSPFKPTGARKSKINDNFFIMKERLEERMMERREEGINNDSGGKKNVSFQLTRIPYDMLEECYRHEHKPTEWSVITLNNETKNIPIGIEDSFTPITKANSRKLDCIEIDDIEVDSRIYLDGRFREGDHIKEINGRPVYQMSSQRVKSYFEEMKSMENPSLTLDVPYEEVLKRTEEIKNRNLKNCIKNQPSEVVAPVQSKLQQVNSTLIKSNEKDIVLRKTSNGFGFNVTSRFNAQNECLLYVSTVKLDSVAYGILEIGDRILKLNNESLINSSQNHFVSQLKAVPVGGEVTLCIARSDEDKKEDNNDNKEGNISEDSIEKRQSPKTRIESGHKKDNSQTLVNSSNEKIEIKDILLPFNSTPSSGLGISLKARCIHKANGEKQDVGIFVKKALVGGAAYNSGLLKENDRLIGIEGIDLTQYSTNKKAFETIADCLNSLDKNKTHVKLKISRIIPNNKVTDEESLRNVKVDVVRDDYYNDDLYEPNNPVSPALIRAEKNGVTSVTVNDQDTDMPPVNYIQNEDDLYFDRQSKTRQSISEKRKNVSNNDPSNLEVFQRIKHLRQTSAPTTTTQSLSKYSPMLNAKLQNINSSPNASINEKSIDVNEKMSKLTNKDSHNNFQSTSPFYNHQYKPQRSRSSDMTQKKSYFEKNKNVPHLGNLNNSFPQQNTHDNIINIGCNEMPTIEKYEKHMYQGPAIKAIVPPSTSLQFHLENRKENPRIPPPTYSQTLDKKVNLNRYTMIDPSVPYHVMKQPIIVPHHQNVIFHSPLPPPRFGGREGTKHEIQINNDYYDAFNNYFVASETIPIPSNGTRQIVTPKMGEKNYPFLEKAINPHTLKKKNLYDGKSHSVFYYDTATPLEIRKSGVTVKRF